MTRKHAVLAYYSFVTETLGSSRVSFACLLIIPMNLIRSKRFTVCCRQGCRFLLRIGRDNLQFYPNFALFSTWGRNEPRPRFFFQISKVIEDKKHVFTKIEGFFPDFKCCRPTSTDFRCRPESNYWGRRSKKLLGGIYHPWL